MKFLVYVAMVTISGVTAGSTAAAPTVSVPTDGDKDCLANYIVRQCLQSENEKVRAQELKLLYVQFYKLTRLDSLKPAAQPTTNVNAMHPKPSQRKVPVLQTHPICHGQAI